MFVLSGGFLSFRQQFTHLCVERLPAAAAAATPGNDDDAGNDDDGGGSCATGAAVSARRQLLCINNDTTSTTDIFGLSNLRLSSSAPSSSSAYLVSCPSPVRARQPSPRRPAWRCDTHLPFPVQVLSNLYLGDAATARDLDCLRRHNIQYIVNVTADVENAFEDDSTLTYMRIAITDHPSETPTSFFTAAINFIGLLLSSVCVSVCVCDSTSGIDCLH